MKNKINKRIAWFILLALITSFSIQSLSLLEFSSKVGDFSLSDSSLSTQDILWPPNSSEWTEVAPEEQGLNSSKIEEMFDFINSSQMNIHSVIIARNGYLLLEEYLNNSQIYRNATGDKEYWYGGFIHDQASTTKSLMSLLIGIALQEGFLDDLSQTLYEFFADIWEPTFTNSERKKIITIEELLTMTSGLVGSGGHYPHSGALEGLTEDCIEWALDDVPLQFLPGGEAHREYSNDGPNLLSGIITEITGKSAEEFAREYLFEPLQISEDEYYWWNDSKGIDYGGYAFECSPKVQAKLGLLALNNGIWDGRQILKPNYMKDATTSIIGDLSGYGYLWWITKSPFEGFYAVGAGGQCIYVIPEYNIVVGFTASGDPSYQQMIADYILHNVEPDPDPDPIPDDPAIPGFNLNVIFLTVFCAAVVILIRSKKTSKN